MEHNNARPANGPKYSPKRCESTSPQCGFPIDSALTSGFAVVLVNSRKKSSASEDFLELSKGSWILRLDVVFTGVIHHANRLNGFRDFHSVKDIRCRRTLAINDNNCA